MFVIIGSIVVLVAVFGGFVLEGGPLKLIVQPVEFLIIGGAALGAMVISAPKKLLMKIIARVMASLKGGAVNRDLYLDLLRLMYEIFQVTRKDGLIASNPISSTPIRARYSPSTPTSRGITISSPS
jgi:chemotaxis protein MotA